MRMGAKRQADGSGFLRNAVTRCDGHNAVLLGDGNRCFMKAKKTLSVNARAWNNLWHRFARQFKRGSMAESDVLRWVDYAV